MKRRDRPGGDEGATLIETLVSLAIVMVAMASMGTYFVGSVLIVAQQRTGQDAAQLANSAIEQIRALRGSSLVTGRAQIKTDLQWCAAPPKHRPITCLSTVTNAATPYLANLKEVWDPQITDPLSTLGDDAAVSTATQTMFLDNITFARTVYVGACDIYVGTSGACVNPDDTPPPSDSTRDLQFYRAVVLITWPCRTGTGTCSYVTSTLLSRASEPVFDFHRPSPIVTPSTATLYQGVTITYQLPAVGGQLPNTWTASPLPAGLTVTPAGVVSGTPTLIGSTATSATVTDKLGRSDTGKITFNVVAPVTLTVPANQVGHVGDTINLAATASGGLPPYTYSQTGLPNGLSLDPNSGAITGTVTSATPAPRTVTITATDSNGTVTNPITAPASKQASYTHTVWPAVALAAIADQQITLGQSFSTTASGSGGDGKFTYTASGLPVGVLINASTGAISGLPTAAGRYLPTVTVTDGSSGTASVRFALVVNTTTSLIFTSPSPSAPDQSSQLGKQTSVDLGTNASALGLSPTMTVTGLPPGLTLNPANGKVSGKPTTAGTYTVTAVATSLTPPQVSNMTFLWTVA